MSRGAMIALVAVAILTACLGYFVRARSEVPAAVVAVPADQLTPVGLLELALDAEPHDAIRADLLAQAAVDQLANDPAAFAGFWHGFDQYLKNRPSLTAEEKLARLLLLEEAFEAACRACRTQDQLDALWPVHERLRASTRSARETVFAKVASEVQQFEAEREDKPLTAWLLELAILRPSWQRRISAANVAPLTSLQEQHLTELRQISAGWNQQVEDTWKEILAEINADTSSLVQNEIQLTPSGADGPLQEQLGSLDELVQALDLTQLGSWEDLLQDDQARPIDESQTEGSLLAQYSEIAGKCATLQRLHYNLWAVNQLSTAEASDNWPDYLGVIDVSLLEPATAALYSLVYEKRIRALSDSSSQSDVVRQILRRSKQTLQSF